MGRFFNSLSFKIGLLIIVIETVFLMIMGIIYINRFSSQVDKRITNQVQLPGLLMNAGLMTLDSVSDAATMNKLFGSELISGMVFGINGNIFYSLDSSYIGKNISEINDINQILPDFNDPEEHIHHLKEAVVTISPVFASDKKTVRFFVYTVVSTVVASEEKREIIFLFFSGAIISLILTSFAIMILFTRFFSRRIISLVRVFRKMASGDLSVRINKTESSDEIGYLQKSFSEMIEARQHSDAQIIHLNRILKAIRNVNQMITMERDSDHLLERVCDFLIEIDSYESSWIVILDEKEAAEKFFFTNRSGLKMSMKELSEQAGVIQCFKAILSHPGAHVIHRESPVCRHCFLNKGSAKDNNTLGIRLEYDGKLYGILNIHVDSEFEIDSEEISLFEEVAGDISFALSNFDREEKRLKIEKELQISQERFKMAMDASCDGLYDLNLITNEIYYSPGWKKMLGYEPEELPDEYSVWENITKDEDVIRAKAKHVQMLKDKDERINLEFQMKHKDGHYIDILSRARAVFDESGRAIRIIGTHQDITSRKQSEKKLLGSLEERDALLRELYHRTKNNMQLIVSLLSMKMTGIQNEEMNDILFDVENKIQSMALVHQMLYQGKNLSQIDLKLYISDLFENMIHSSGFDIGGIKFVHDLESVLISIDTAIPLGMIFSELITNTIKHAFKDFNPSEDFVKTISVSLHVSDGKIFIDYSDNGKGCDIPDDFSKIDSMGLQTIIGLMESQLQGSIKCEQHNGLLWHFTLEDQPGRSRL